MTPKKRTRKKHILTTIGGILMAIASVAKAYEVPTGKLGKASGADLAIAGGMILTGVAAADKRSTKAKDEE